MPRAIWKGSVSFGLVSIPVGIYPAVSRNELSFHLLDKRDMQPVKNVRTNAGTGKEVEWDDIVKGYELDDGRWVTVTDEDFAAANVKATQTIDVLAAVCREEIGPEYFESPYFLVPERGGAKPYALLRAALQKADRIAVAKVVIRTRQRLALIVPEGDVLLLSIVRWPYELRSAADLELPEEDLGELGVTDAEVQLAEQLVSTISAQWDPSQYRDTYHDDLRALIERKASGEAIEPPPPVEEETGKVVDIMELLKKSVEEARSGRDEGGAEKTGRAKAASGS